MRFSNKLKLRKELTPEAVEALQALRVANKPISEMVEWLSADTFRMRKAEDTSEGLKITTKSFQIKEIK
jgi:DNA-binding TFAR19-related protein (PDSD5 family)